jgi:hypothetical protein
MTTVTGSTIEHPIGPAGLLAIRIRDGEVHLRGIDGDIARVRDLNDAPLEDMFDIDTSDGGLALTARRGADLLRAWTGLEGGIGGWIGLEGDWLGLGTGGRRHTTDERRERRQRRRGSWHTPELMVELPRGASVVVDSVSGDLVVDRLSGDQRYRTTSGDVTLRAVSGRLSVEAASGDVDIRASGTAELTVRTVSGDVEMRAGTVSSVRAATTSGDLRIAGRFAGSGPFSIETVSGDGLLAPAGDVQIQMTSVTGDLTSEFEGPTVTRGRRSLTIGRSGPIITFRSMSGDLHVVHPIPEATHEPEPDDAPGGSARSVGGAGGLETDSATLAAKPAGNGAIAAAYEDARLRILRSLERGEITVDEAERRLATLDRGEPEIGPVDPRDA